MSLDPRLKKDLKKYLVARMREADEQLSIIAAQPLSAADRKSILKHVGMEDDPSIEVRVDPSLMAGVILKKGSNLIDLSLKGRLMSLQQSV